MFLFPVEKPGEKTANEWLIKENTYNKLFLAKFIRGIYCPKMMVGLWQGILCHFLFTKSPSTIEFSPIFSIFVLKSNM